MKKYLPSKKFVLVALISILAASASLFAAGKLKANNDGTYSVKRDWSLGEAKAEEMTLKDLVEKDSDGDGVPDWEEALWGLDPNNPQTNEDASDNAWVVKRREEIKKDQEKNGELPPSDDLNETDKFSREFFTTVAALNQSGVLDQRAVSNISNVLSEKVTDVNLSDPYRESDIKKTTGGPGAKFDYYDKLRAIYGEAVALGLGSEIGIVSGETDVFDRKMELQKIAAVYKDFATAAEALSVPEDLASRHLRIMNSASNAGLAVGNMSKIGEDPLIGLIGVAQYQKYSAEFVSAAEDLRQYLESGDIILE